MTPAQIREARKSLGLTQEQLAAVLKVSRRTVLHWEADTRTPEPAKVALLTAFLSGYRPADWPKGDDK